MGGRAGRRDDETSIATFKSAVRQNDTVLSGERVASDAANGERGIARDAGDSVVSGDARNRRICLFYRRLLGVLGI